MRIGFAITGAGHLLNESVQVAEKLAENHEERGSWRMTHLHLLCCGDKLRTIPKAGGRLNRGAISERGNGEHYPACDVVD